MRNAVVPRVCGRVSCNYADAVVVVAVVVFVVDDDDDGIDDDDWKGRRRGGNFRKAFRNSFNFRK